MRDTLFYAESRTPRQRAYRVGTVGTVWPAKEIPCPSKFPLNTLSSRMICGSRCQLNITTIVRANLLKCLALRGLRLLTTRKDPGKPALGPYSTVSGFPGRAALKVRLLVSGACPARWTIPAACP